MGIGVPGLGIARRDNVVEAHAFLALESYIVENAPGFFVGDNSKAMQEVCRSISRCCLDSSAAHNCKNTRDPVDASPLVASALLSRPSALVAPIGAKNHARPLCVSMGADALFAPLSPCPRFVRVEERKVSRSGRGKRSRGATQKNNSQNSKGNLPSLTSWEGSQKREGITYCSWPWQWPFCCGRG